MAKSKNVLLLHFVAFAVRLCLTFFVFLQDIDRNDLEGDAPTMERCAMMLGRLLLTETSSVSASVAVYVTLVSDRMAWHGMASTGTGSVICS